MGQANPSFPMPKAIEADIKRSVRKSHPGYSDKQVTSEAFAIMNKQGLVHGNKETAHGRAAERHHNTRMTHNG